jgi:dnd system-associated protein 4
MIDKRVRYSKGKADFVGKLVYSDESKTAPFKQKSDALAFAAALGLKRDRKTTLGNSYAEPIRLSVFEGQYDILINLIALHEKEDPKLLSNSPADVDHRVTIFEEYANGGLEILMQELSGVVDITESILLLVNSERHRTPEELKTFDLSSLI